MLAKRPKKRWYGSVFCCLGSPNTCNNLTLLKADESEFHDSAIINATDEINGVLARLREQQPEGRHLALIDTSMGLLLVWAESSDPPEDYRRHVTDESSEEDLVNALRLRDDYVAKGA